MRATARKDQCFFSARACFSKSSNARERTFVCFGRSASSGSSKDKGVSIATDIVYARVGAFPASAHPARSRPRARDERSFYCTLAHTRANLYPTRGGKSRDVPRAREGRSRAELRQPRVRTRYDECRIECARTVHAPRRARGFDRMPSERPFVNGTPQNSRENESPRELLFFNLPIKRGSN